MVGPRVTVLTVLWKGDFRSREYDEEWVRKMQRMVLRAVPSARFVCLTNVEIADVETISLECDLPGWWSKIELFRPDLPVNGRLLYLDLDTLIVGDLSDLINFEPTPAFMPPSYEVHGGIASGKSDVVDVYNSSVIVWDKGQGREFYQKFHPDRMKEFRGDQDWFGYVSDGYETLPPSWFSKLRHCQKGPSPDHKIVLCMPWKNDQAAQHFEWVDRIWNQ